jgi:hypothetical protein
MAGTIKISSDLDARGFLKGTSNMEEALEDVSKELDKTGKEGVKDIDKLENKFSDAAKAAKDAGNDMRKGMGDGFKGVQDAGNQAATDIKDEFKSNLSEVTSSFNGSVESMGDLVQGTLGGLVGSLGPAGMAAGAAGALGVGLVIAKLTQAAEEAERSKERIKEMGLAIIDSGADVAGLESFNEEMKLIITNSDDARKKLEDIEKLVGDYPELAGDVGLMAQAYAGNEDAMDGALDALDKIIEQEKIRTGQGTEGAVSMNEALLDSKETLIQIQKETEAAQKIEQDWLNSGGAESLAKAEAIGLINSAYDNAASSISEFKDEESGVIDVQAYIDSMAAREKALQDYQTAVAESGFSTEQKQALNDMGVEASADFMAGYKAASPAQQAEMQKILTNMASESSGVAVKEMEKAFEKPVEAKVEAKVDMKLAQQDLDNLIKARTAVIKLDFRDRNGKAVD